MIQGIQLGGVGRAKAEVPLLLRQQLVYLVTDLVYPGDLLVTDAETVMTVLARPPRQEHEKGDEENQENKHCVRIDLPFVRMPGVDEKDRIQFYHFYTYTNQGSERPNRR